MIFGAPARMIWITVDFSLRAYHLSVSQINVLPGSTSYNSEFVNHASERAASLIGCRCADLMLALSTYKIQPGKDNVAKNLTLQQAIDKRDALAKFVHASLFNWLVGKINKSIEKGERQAGRSISILDIYGFESFQKNSLEQLCIDCE